MALDERMGPSSSKSTNLMESKSNTSNGRSNWMSVVPFRVTVVLCLLLILPATEGLRCLSCKGCSKFEESQAVLCSSSHDRCLKLLMPSGLINRECGDEKICLDKSNDRSRHSAVHCCDSNMCNGAPEPGRTGVILRPLAGSLLVGVAASFRFLF